MVVLVWTSRKEGVDRFNSGLGVIGREKERKVTANRDDTAKRSDTAKIHRRIRWQRL